MSDDETFGGDALEDGPTCSECGEEWPHGCLCYSEGIKAEPNPDDYVQVEERYPPTEPEENDLVTTDHIKFWDNGMFGHRKPAVVVREDQDWRREVKRYMLKQNWFPNVWFISDHGNAHLLNLNGDFDEETEVSEATE